MTASPGRSRRLVTGLLGAALLLSSGPSWAQDAGTVVEGTVVDDRTGAPIEGVQVIGVAVAPAGTFPSERTATADSRASSDAPDDQAFSGGACGCPLHSERGVDPLLPGIGPYTEEFDRAVTDAEGRFQLDGTAPPDGWSVRVSFVDETDRDFRYLRQDLEFQRDGPGSTVVDVELVRSGQVRGRVADAQTGEAVSGVEVWVQLGGFRSAITGADGSYEVRDVTPGSHRVSFQPTEDTRPARDYRNQYFGGVADEADATAVAVERGEATTGIDAALVPGASLAGSVTGLDGGPLAGIGVTVVDAETGHPGTPATSTDARGEWQIDGLAAGSYQILYTRPPIAEVAPEGYAPTWAGGSSFREDAEVAVVEAGDLTRIEPTRVVPAGAIRGRLTERGSEVPVRTACITVVDEAGREVGDGEVGIGSIAFEPGEPRLGEYEIDQLPPGTHRVLFETPGCGSGPEDQPSHEPRWHGDAAVFDGAAPVPVTSGDLVTDVDGVLDPRPPLGLREGVVGQVGRVAGPDRVATAIEIARRATEGQGADTVVVARADQYADAIVGGPLAARFGAPILLSGGDRLDERVSALLADLVPRTAYLLGGEAALSPRVEADLLEVGVAEVVRVAGDDRFATAVAIADRVIPQAERQRGSPTAYLVEGANADPSRGWPDALAAAQGITPVLLTERDFLPEATRQALGTFVAVTIVGGDAAVSPEVEQAVSREGVEAHRIGGATRYETFRSLLGPAGSRPWLVTGRDWPDALTAGAGAHLDRGGLVLVDGSMAPTSADLNELAGSFANLDRVLLIGGPAALGPAFEDAIRERAGFG